MLEQRGVCPPEEALCGGRTVGAADVEVVHGRKRGEPAIAQAMTPVMMQRQLAVASLHTGTAALEQIGAGPGDLFDPRALLGRETLQRMIGAPQRVEQRGTHRIHAVSGLGRGAAGGDALEIDGRDELLEDCHLQLRGQREGSDPGCHGGFRCRGDDPRSEDRFARLLLIPSRARAFSFFLFPFLGAFLCIYINSLQGTQTRDHRCSNERSSVFEREIIGVRTRDHRSKREIIG